MEQDERPARGQRGFLLRSTDGDLFFRIYDSKDKREFRDYKINHSDLAIVIVDDYSAFYEKPCADWDGTLDYKSRVLRKQAPTNKE